MKKILSVLTVCVIAMTAAAVPARRGPITRMAEDGTKKTVFLHGDAFSHHMTDEAGNWLDEKTLQPMSAEQRAQREQHNAARAQMRRVQQEKQVGGALNLAPRGLLIMVNFANKAFTTPAETIHEMINGETFTRNYEYDYQYEYEGGTYTQHVIVKSSGSARQYFHDSSWGQYNPQFDVVGPYLLKEPYSYYGENNDANVGEMIKEACEMADADGVDFTLYDNDNDGNVDFVYVLYAGYGQADGGPESTIWPHNYDLRYTGVSCTVDEKSIRNYACSNEISYYSKLYNGIGTFCHEFSHVLGLPDLYETNSPSKGLHTLFDWDILDYGPYNNDGNTPPAYSAYERFYMGWLTPRVLTDPEYIRLNPLNDSQEALLLCSGDQHNLVGNEPNPTTFYLVECRTQTGWDQYLPGAGMLITKIKYNSSNWVNNKVNNSATNMGVDIIEAEKNTSDFSDPKDAFPAGAASWTEFTDHEITNIALQTDGAVAFSYRGADPTDDPTETVIVTAKLPDGAPAAGVEIIGTFDGWKGTAMSLVDGVWTAQVEAKASDCFKFREAGSWNNEILVFEEGQEPRVINDGELVFGKLWQESTLTVVGAFKEINIDLSDPAKYEWLVSGEQDIQTKPTTAPAVPTEDEDNVMAIFCNHYARNNANFWISGWAGGYYEVLDLEGTNVGYWTEMTWECIIDPEHTDDPHDFSAYKKLHVDMWAPAPTTIKFTVEAVPGSNYKDGIVCALNQGWNSINIDLTEWPGEYDFTNLKLFVFENYMTPTGESFEGNPFAFANLYFFDKKAALPNVIVNVTPENSGKVEVVYQDQQHTSAILTARPSEGYKFVQWSDGNKENPRTIVLNEDITIEAIFAEMYPQIMVNDIWYKLDIENKSAKVVGIGIGDVISVEDNSIDDWNTLPADYVAEAKCPKDAALLGLKSVKVYADETYINALVELNMDDITDLEWVPFHVYLDADNSDATGGFGDNFLDANTDLLCETAVFAEGQPFSYNPAVFKWWGGVGADGWEWTDPSVSHDETDCWGAVICEGQLPVGASQFVDGKLEIQLSREMLGTAFPLNNDEFGIGFDIQQNWSAVGILPCGIPTDENHLGIAPKLKVKIYHNNLSSSSENISSIVIPSSIEHEGVSYSVTSIGNEAFRGCSSLTNVILGSQVEVLEEAAFYGCTAIETITCYSQRPPTVNEGALHGLDYSTIVYVPADYLNNYIMHDVWRLYDVRALGATNTETNDVNVTPTENTAIVVWPSVSGAVTYELVIKDKNGNVICTLIFNANGQLTEIVFAAPSRDGGSREKQATGFSFTVTGLNAGTSYDLSLTAKDENGDTLEEKKMSFTTQSKVPTAIDEVSGDEQLLQTTKILRNGQVLIQRGEKLYTLQGQEVK